MADLRINNIDSGLLKRMKTQAIENDSTLRDHILALLEWAHPEKAKQRKPKGEKPNA